MRSRLFIATMASVLIVVAGAVAVYLYDAGHSDAVAKGVRVAGVDVGGLSADRARAALGREVARPLAQPVVVRYRGRSFTLSARQARVQADVPGMVREAVARSRTGNVLTRTARDLTGGSVHADLPPRLTYSRAAVNALAARVERGIDRPARDAHLSYSASHLGTVPGRPGLSVRGGQLRSEIEAAIAQPQGDRLVRPAVATVKPKLTTQQLAKRDPTVVLVDRSGFTLRLYRHLKLVKSYQIAVGMSGLETPAGLYHVQDKEVNPAWHVPNSSWAGSLAGQVIPGGASNNPLKARWLGIADGAGIHGTAETGSLGSAASHGCIRMSVSDVEQLYPQVPVGAPVYIG